MTANARSLVYRVAELAAFLGWCEETIRREIKDGRLRARKLRSDTVIVESDLLAWLDNLPVVPVEMTAEDTEDGDVTPTPITTTRSTRHRRVTRRVEAIR